MIRKYGTGKMFTGSAVSVGNLVPVDISVTGPSEDDWVASIRIQADDANLYINDQREDF